jgi:hypothetical protein
MKPFKKELIFNKAHGLFMLTDLFNLEKGKIDESQESGYPLITTSEQNNGVSGFYEDYSFENCFTISGDGGCGMCFWHPYKFNAYVNVVVASPKFKIGDFSTMTALATIISAYLKYKRFNYGRKSGLDRLEDQHVALPLTDNDDIDWEYMREKNKSAVTKIINHKIKLLQDKVNEFNTDFIKPEFN